MGRDGATVNSSTPSPSTNGPNTRGGQPALRGPGASGADPADPTHTETSRAPNRATQQALNVERLYSKPWFVGLSQEDRRPCLGPVPRAVQLPDNWARLSADYRREMSKLFGIEFWDSLLPVDDKDTLDQTATTRQTQLRP